MDRHLSIQEDQDEAYLMASFPYLASANAEPDSFGPSPNSENSRFKYSSTLKCCWMVCRWTSILFFLAKPWVGTYSSRLTGQTKTELFHNVRTCFPESELCKHSIQRPCPDQNYFAMSGAICPSPNYENIWFKHSDPTKILWQCPDLFVRVRTVKTPDSTTLTQPELSGPMCPSLNCRYTRFMHSDPTKIPWQCPEPFVRVRTVQTSDSTTLTRPELSGPMCPSLHCRNTWFILPDPDSTPQFDTVLANGLRQLLCNQPRQLRNVGAFGGVLPNVLDGYTVPVR